MTSFRRSMSVMQRDGAVQNGEATSDDTSPSPKLGHGRTYLAFIRFLNSLDILAVSDRVRAYVPGIFLQRPWRPVERSKPRGAHLRHAFFHFFICFMLGIFISFTPILSVDMSKNFVSKQQAFSFEVDSVTENSQRKMYSVEKEDLVFDKSHSKGNFSLDVVAKQDMGSEAVDGDHEAPASDAIPPFEESELESWKLLIVVTPTYVRPLQAYYLNRLAHTLRIVPPPLLWIVVEMSSQSTETAEILRKTGVMYRHLVCNQNVTNIKDKGVHQRNIALSHIEKHQLDGIVYFADDDRMFSVDLFDQMRQIRRFGTWPVATLTGNKNRVLLEGPICNGSQVIGWHTNQRSKLARRFHVDMSGFAFNSTILWDPKRWHRPTSEPIRQHDAVKEGYQETTFIEQLVEDESQMEGFPSDCSRVMAWHLHLEAPELLYAKGWLMQENLEVVAPVT